MRLAAFGLTFQSHHTTCCFLMPPFCHSFCCPSVGTGPDSFLVCLRVCACVCDVNHMSFSRDAHFPYLICVEQPLPNNAFLLVLQQQKSWVPFSAAAQWIPLVPLCLQQSRYIFIVLFFFWYGLICSFVVFPTQLIRGHCDLWHFYEIV